jgi:uncharacterized membrane protein
MWFFYSLFFAVWSSFQIFITKKLTKTLSPMTILYGYLIFSIPLTFLFLLFVGGVPKTTANFYVDMGIAGFLDTFAFLASYLAISKSSISLIAPISSFGPVFTTLIAIFALNEIPAPLKFVGILLTVFGAYLLNVADIKQGILVPFKTLFSHRGVLLYLLANLLWSITPIFQKKAIFETTPQIPLFASIIGMVFGLMFLTPFAFKRLVVSLKEIKQNTQWFVLNGLGTAFSQAAAYAAFALVFVGYASSIFRLSTLFIIILGGIFLKEERIKERLLGASVMVIGAILLAL